MSMSLLLYATPLFWLSLLMILLPTEVGFLSRAMNLVSLSFEGWLLCAGVASLTLWVSEGYKWVAYRRN